MEQSTFLTERIEDTERIRNEVNRSFEDYMNKLRKKSKVDILKAFIYTEDDSIEEWLNVNDKAINIHLDTEEELTKITSTLETLNHNFNKNIRKMKNELKSLENKNALVVPLSFTIDNSETEFELSIEYAELAHELGFERYLVARCPNDDDAFVASIKNLVLDIH